MRTKQLSMAATVGVISLYAYRGVVLRLPDSWSNWNLEMLFFEETGKPQYPEKNLSEQRREPTTNSTHIWRRRRDLNPGHICGRRALLILRLLLLSKFFFVWINKFAFQKEECTRSLKLKFKMMFSLITFY